MNYKRKYIANSRVVEITYVNSTKVTINKQMYYSKINIYIF